MSSSLYWRMGFGWTTVFFLVILLIGIISFKGVPKGISIALFILVSSYACYRVYSWNGSPWRRVHGRGMLVYATCAGSERATSLEENRDFSSELACYQMAIQICGANKEMEVSMMIGELSGEKGSYFANLIARFGKDVDARLTDDAIEALTDITRKIDLCPQLIIANIIENTYGQLEATRYSIAVLTGKAV